jgi:photosystem II stability/assembly factor-like uncharacterized protein
MVLMIMLRASSSWTQQWKVLGPDGGDARSLSYDPRNPDRIFVGTGNGTIFISHDGGRNWSRSALLGDHNDYVLDHIVVGDTPDTMFVSAWSVSNGKTGDLFRSEDGGRTWQSLEGVHGKSIRALGAAAADPRILIAGAIDGIYRSKDRGDTWERISPSNRLELRNIESIAIDPRNPNTIYAGTWHLAWKTTDGGINWHKINKGMVDDSDVFSIIVDSSNPSIVFASACSGIYRSDTFGETFQKIQGIPFSARRTRVLKQDPANPNIVYAGTTEGLWKTINRGKNWQRIGNIEVVVNDVLIDPRDSKHLLLATDRSGIVASDDGGQTLAASNRGYTHRYVSTILVDKEDPSALFVGVVNDREWGGVFSFHDNDQHWEQKSAGLGGRDVLVLKETSEGRLIAGTNRGIFILDRDSRTWQAATMLDNGAFRNPTNKLTNVKLVENEPISAISSVRINDIQITTHKCLAATSAGLFISSDGGRQWRGNMVLGKSNFVSVQSKGDIEVLATRKDVLISTDGGLDWDEARLPANLADIRGVVLTPDAEILIASREGAFRSSNNRQTWTWILNGLPKQDISSITYDEENQRLLATVMTGGTIFESRDSGRSWRSVLDAGYPLRHISVSHGHLLATTPFDGVVIQP